MKITQTITIDVPPSKVFDFISNFENNPKWQNGMKSCKIIDNQPLGIGQTYDQIAEFLGKTIVSTFQVIEFDPGHLVKATTIKSSFPITFTRIVEGDSTSHVTAIVEGDSKGFFKIFSPIMTWMVKSSIKKDYERLKVLLES